MMFNVFSLILDESFKIGYVKTSLLEVVLLISWLVGLFNLLPFAKAIAKAITGLFVPGTRLICFADFDVQLLELDM